jgi:methyl-accepting chemotaxis protein
MAARRESGSRGRAWRAVLSPGVALMNRLRYGPKFVLIGVLVLVPLVAVAYLLYDSTTYDIDFNNKESDGVAYITGLRKFMHSVEQHRILSAAGLAGRRGYEDRLVQSRTEADRLLTEIDGLDARLGTDLKTTTPWVATRKAWIDLRGMSFTSVEASDREHAQVAAMLVDLILNYAGNYSNLILDPDLDSYWLMDAYITKLPLLMDTQTKASLLALRGAAAGLSADDRIELAGLYKLAGSITADLVNVNFKTIYSYQEEQGKGGLAKTALDDGLRRTEAQNRIYLAGLRTRLAAAEGAAAVVADPLVDESLAAIESVHVFWDKVSPELDGLIQARVARYRQDRRLGIGLTLLAAALLIFLFVAFYTAVRESLQSLRGATERMIAGTSDTFAPESRDEIGDIGGYYNDLNRALVESRSLQARVEKENRSLQDSILGLLRVVSDAADGDLTVRAQVTEGALGNVADAFNQMVETWRGLLGEVQQLFDRASDAVAQIEASSSGMAVDAHTQTQEIAGAHGAVQRMAESIGRVSQNAEVAATAAKRTQDSALEGSEAVQKVVRGMDSLRTSVQAGAKRIKNLGDRSMEITSIVSVIARISEQTNMLALNAAIEAARAGEFGRGFNVVADQVRQLAERAAAATVEIGALVRAIQTETNESVDAMERQTETVEGESRVVVSAGDALSRIKEVSTLSAELIGDINEAARQQVDGAEGVARVMDQISEIARRTKDGADASVQHTRSLAALTAQLRAGVARFRLS